MYKGPRFIVEFKINIEPYQEDILNKDYYKCNRLYNNAARYAIKQINQLKRTKKYKKAVEGLKKCKDKKAKQPFYKDLKDLEEQYSLTKSNIEKYMKAGNKRAFGGTIKAQVFQSLAKELYLAINSSIYKGTDLKYRKYGSTNTLSSKSANCTILYDKDKNIFRYNNNIYRLKDIRPKDYYAYEAIDNDISYCMIVRKLIGSKYSYYLQIVFRGLPPKKLSKGEGNLGIDQGTSTVAFYKDDLMGFIELAPSIKSYNKEILKLQRSLERKLRLNNPDNYDKDGTIKKGSKFKRSNNYKKELLKLKDLYRKRSIYVKEEHNKLVNFIIQNTDTIIKETINFKALQRRSKGKTQRQDKESTVKNKKGKSKKVFKFKKKKRFGKSLNNHSPGYLDSQLLKKANEYDIKVVEVDMLKYRASQYMHDKDEYIKPKLSNRVKVIDGKKVQRDLYSAFLLSNYKDEESIDRDKCIKGFNSFIQKQTDLIKTIKDNTGNFGLKEFA